MLWIIVACLVNVASLNAIDVYVGGEGKSTDTCGSKARPCLTINHVIKIRYPTASKISVKVLSTINEPATVRIRRAGHFSVEGVRGKDSIINVNGEKLFEIWNVDVHLTFSHLTINIRWYFFDIYSYYSRVVEVIMNNTTLQQTQPLGKSESVMNIEVSGNEGKKSCGVKVVMEDCNFNNINAVSLLHLEPNNCTTSLVTTNSVFYNNTFQWYGFGVWPIHSSVEFHLINVTANYNSVKESALFELDIDEGVKANFQVVGCYFTNNEGEIIRAGTGFWGYGNEVIVRSNKDVTFSMIVMNTSLTNNNLLGRADGHIFFHRTDSQLTHNQSHVWNLTLRKVVARGNKGSPLYVRYEKMCGLRDAQNKCAKTKPGIEHFKKLDILVTSSEFIENHGLRHGGAIWARTNSYISTMQLTVLSSRFLDNTAGTGGGISSNCHTIIQNSQFLNNYATTGGAISLRGMSGIAKRTDTKRTDVDEVTTNEITDSNFTTKTIALDSATDLDVSNLKFQLANHTSGNRYIFRHESASRYLQITGGLSFECGINTNANYTITKAKYDMYSKKPTKKESKYISHLSVSCQSCLKGHYTINKGKARMYDGKLNTSVVKCHTCPRGGNCELGALRSRRHYWGFQTKKRLVKFTLCPKVYCSEKPSSYSTCSANRQGVLCSQCQLNSSLDIFSSACVDTSTCDVSSILYVVGLFPCVLILLVMAMIFKENLKQLLERSTRKLKTKFGVLKTSLKRCCKSRDETILLSAETEQQPDSAVDNRKSTLKQFLLIVSYYQLQNYIYLSNAVLAPVWGNLQKYMGTFSMFNFIGGDALSSAVNYCFPQDFDFIDRCSVNIFINLSPIILSALIYIIVSCYERRFGPKEFLKRQILCTALTFIGIFYIPIASTLLRLVTCVDIVQHGEDITVLFEQGSVQCYQRWQYGVVVFISVYLVWYFLVLYVGTFYLKEQKYVQFLIMLFLPITSVFFLIKYGYALRSDSAPEIENENVMEMDTITPTDDEPKEIEATHSLLKQDVTETQIDSSYEEDDQEITVVSNPEEQPLQNSGLNDEERYSSLIEAIQGVCRIVIWPSIIVVRNLSVALVPVLFRHDYSQVLALLVIILLYLILLVHTKPYTDSVMNLLEPTLMSMLLLLGVCGIVNTTYLTSSDDNIRSFLEIIDYLRVVLLLLPLPLWIIFILINNYILPKTSPAEVCVQVALSGTRDMDGPTVIDDLSDNEAAQSIWI